MAKAAKAAPEAKRPVGRPTLYRPEYCERVVELGKQGKSRVQIADALDLNSRSTLDDWAEVHPEFSEALTRAKMAEQAYWEELGHQALFADRFQAVVWKTSMQARFREDYTEKRINEHSGPGGGPIQQETRTVDASALTAEERAAMRALMLAAKGKVK
jgi:hypothetical protein